jgi:Fe-S cluster assembly protein SufB
MNKSESNLENLVNQPYKYGFVTDIETETIKKGLNQDVIRLISKKKQEPNFMLEFRLSAFEKWKKMDEPEWAYLDYPKPNYQEIGRAHV